MKLLVGSVEGMGRGVLLVGCVVVVLFVIVVFLFGWVLFVMVVLKVMMLFLG